MFWMITKKGAYCTIQVQVSRKLQEGTIGLLKVDG